MSYSDESDDEYQRRLEDEHERNGGYERDYGTFMVEQKLKSSYEELLVNSIYQQSIGSSDIEAYKEVSRIVSPKLSRESIDQCFKRAFKLVQTDVESGKHPVSCLAYLLPWATFVSDKK